MFRFMSKSLYGYKPLVVSDLNFDPVKDLHPVDQFGFVDLHDAFVNASIPGDLQYEESGFNGVEDPASLVGRHTDYFDAIRKGQYVKSAESVAAAKAKATTPGDSE